MSVSDAILLALLSAAFGAGTFAATIRGKISQALRIGRRAHARIDELENQTGQHTTLRGSDDG